MNNIYHKLIKHEIENVFPWDSVYQCDEIEFMEFDKMLHHLSIRNFDEVIELANIFECEHFLVYHYCAYASFAKRDFSNQIKFSALSIQKNNSAEYEFQKNRAATLLFDGVIRGGFSPASHFDLIRFNKHIYNFYKCIIDIIHGDIERNSELLSFHFRNMPIGSTIPLHNGAKTLTSPSEIKKIESENSPCELFDFLVHEDIIEHYPVNDRVIYYTACDVNYFNLFSEQYLSGLEITHPNALVHIDILTPDDVEVKMPALSSVKSNKNLRINFTITKFKPIKRLVEKPFFASYRFAKLSRYLLIYNIPLLTTDIDLIPNKIDPLNLSTKDVVVYQDAGRNYYPWQRYPAGWLLTKPEMECFNFLDTLKKCINFHLRKASFFNVGIWFIDQSLLFSIIRKNINSNSFNLGGSQSKKPLFFNFNYGSEIKKISLKDNSKHSHMELTLSVLRTQITQDRS